MTTKINKSHIDAELEETAKARAKVMRRAEAQGVKPFTSLEDFTGDTEMTAEFDVDEFLNQAELGQILIPFE